MQRRYVERFSLGIQSHFQAGSTTEQKSCLQSVPEAKENIGVPGTTSECKVTCYRVKRRYIKLSVFPAPIPVWRRSSRSHSTAVLLTLASHTRVPPRPAELIPPSAGVVPSLCQAFPRKQAPASSREPVPELPVLQAGQYGPSQRQSSHWGGLCWHQSRSIFAKAELSPLRPLWFRS